MLDHLLGLAVSLPLLGFVSWTWVVHVAPPRRLHRCHAEIRRLETEIYGQVMSGSLVREEDHKALEEFTAGLASKLAPPHPRKKLAPTPPTPHHKTPLELQADRQRALARRERQRLNMQRQLYQMAWDKQLTYNTKWGRECHMCGLPHSASVHKIAGKNIHHLR